MEEAVRKASRERDEAVKEVRVEMEAAMAKVRQETEVAAQRVRDEMEADVRSAKEAIRLGEERERVWRLRCAELEEECRSIEALASDDRRVSIAEDHRNGRSPRPPPRATACYRHVIGM